MPESSQTASGPKKGQALARSAAALAFSAILGVSMPALAAHGGGGGGGHGGFHGGGFHGGGFHGHVAGFHGGRYYGGRYYGGHYHGGYGWGFYPGLGLGLAVGLGNPWGWGYYPPAYGYYGYAQPYAPSTWYYCSNPPGYYPYVGQCYGPWEPVPAT